VSQNSTKLSTDQQSTEKNPRKPRTKKQCSNEVVEETSK